MDVSARNCAARSKAEADSQIGFLRRQRGFNGQEQQEPTLVSMFDNVLHVISADLYQKPSHFLLELIQNADDNTFSPRVTPSLSITLSESGSRHLRTDCNEAGFTFNEIDAITHTGNSTKKGAGSRERGYIGEKGIGFKSVFKVADIVNVVSGHYEFRLDRDKPLGMILPILSQFPLEHRLLGHTQFLLQIRSEGDYKKIQADLCDIEPQLLIFLRKIRQLKIQTNFIQRTYRIQNDADTELGETATILTSQEADGRALRMKYIIVRSKARKLPPEPRREGVATSEVMLAFPVGESNNPTISTQKTFAFLPIDDFGFKFLIHADFLLVASREGLDYDCPWNLALRRALYGSFLSAIKRFASAPTSETEPGLRYMWPKYTKHHRSSHDFWNQLNQDILRHLSYERVLESCDPFASSYTPKELRFVPTEFRFEGDALFDCPSLRSKHLSFKYDQVYEELEPLGVQKISIQDLCEELSVWIAEVGVSRLSTQPPEWHQKVASIFCVDAGLKGHLMSLPIIPLRDGSWVSPRRAHLYLEMGTGDVYVPGGISIYIVDRAASQNSARRHFYEFLGIPTYNPMLVCGLILELHSGNTSRIMDRMPEDIVRDAIYLYKNLHLLGQECSPEIFFLVTNRGQSFRRKTQIYILDKTAIPNLIENYKDTERNPFYILDELYKKLVSDDDWISPMAFFGWLLRSPNISTVPMLLRDNYPTPEWAFLRDTKVTDLLLVLEQTCKHALPGPRLLQAVPELQIECRNGTRRPLAELAIPTEDLLQACPHLDFADLQQPERWKFLAKFGILTTPNTTARLRELDVLASLPIQSVDKDAIHECYRGLSLSSHQEAHMISEAFALKPLVFIARPQPAWVTQGSCVWSAPPALKHVIKLANRYSDCQTLFCSRLEVKNASIKHVADELCALHEGSLEGIVQRCEELLMILKRHLSPESEFTAHQFLRVRHAKVFPVLEVGGFSQPPEPRVVLRALQDADWYIPDRIAFEITFRGKVNMLGFSFQSVKRLEFLWSKLRCQHMYLSSAVSETVEARGSKIRDPCKEHELRTRVRYISYLNTPSDAGLRQKPPLCVWSVPSIVSVRCLGSIEVEENNELITFQEGSHLTIYFRTTIPQSKQSQVNFALAEFFSRRHDINADDKNLLNLILSAPIEELSHIMAISNRFLPEELDNDSSPDCETIVDKMDPDDMKIMEQRHSERADLSVNSSNNQMQYSLREFIPSIQSKSQSIAASAGSFRISKHFQRHSIRTRTRSERLRQALLSSQASASTQEPLLSSSVESGWDPGSPPELTARSSAQQVRTRQIGFLGELFIHTFFERHINDCEPFFASQNQVNMMQRFDNDHDNAYILARVFDIDGNNPGLTFYPSPWRLGLEGMLEFVSAGGYKVCERRVLIPQPS
ncbi:hypothetical protein B0J13DRAFT_504973 [Dactylonectria estremocensis]|uniref:Protein NO VEIN C-terminal domain-containing protein n=1 Tax=Dactylonectria estremocensis TaxID=1079267 RepID=A0A9P9EMF7_9HYPO|nr:hypothetical protein B0J13DRAFT_504973 [Dactylonectria estremocensis]